MKNSVKVYVDKFEQEEEYDNLLYSVIVNIQEKIEESIREGEWYKKITYEIEELKNYDENTIENILHDIFNYDGEELTNEGFNVDMQFNNYTLDYYIAVDTDVNDGHLDYNLMDKLFSNNYLQYIEDINRYIKVFNQYNTVMSNDDDEIIVIDNEQQTKVTFYIDYDKWAHTMERMED